MRNTIAFTTMLVVSLMFTRVSSSTVVASVSLQPSMSMAQSMMDASSSSAPASMNTPMKSLMMSAMMNNASVSAVMSNSAAGASSMSAGGSASSASVQNQGNSSASTSASEQQKAASSSAAQPQPSPSASMAATQQASMSHNTINAGASSSMTVNPSSVQPSGASSSVSASSMVPAWNEWKHNCKEVCCEPDNGGWKSDKDTIMYNMTRTCSVKGLCGNNSTKQMQCIKCEEDCSSAIMVHLSSLSFFLITYALFKNYFD